MFLVFLGKNLGNQWDYVAFWCNSHPNSWVLLFGHRLHTFQAVVLSTHHPSLSSSVSTLPSLWLLLGAQRQNSTVLNMFALSFFMEPIPNVAQVLQWTLYLHCPKWNETFHLVSTWSSENLKYVYSSTLTTFQWSCFETNLRTWFLHQSHFCSLV